VTVRRLPAAALLFCAAASCGQSTEQLPAASAGVDPVIEQFERRVAADPRDHLSATTLAELHLRRADATGDPGAFLRAGAAARTALERSPSHKPALVALARALLGQGKAGEARAIVKTILDEDPRHVGALETAFDVAFAGGDELLAKQYAERLLAINEDPGTLARLARLCERRARPGEAAELYRRAVVAAERLGAMQDEIDLYRRAEARALAALEMRQR
jgi:tetratricopeptide (TPR) repeat protein